jgi:hypothetical protein
MHSNHRKDPTRERSHDRLIPRTVAFRAPVILNPFQQREYLAQLTRIYAGHLPCSGALAWAGGGERLRNGSRPGYCPVTLP